METTTLMQQVNKILLIAVNQAYDHVNWDTLYYLLDHMGFGEMEEVD